MSDLNEIGSWVRENLPTMLADAHIPAASVAILAGGEIFTTAAGILNRNTGIEADEDSVFQIGSITKTWTATLIMQLVDEGLLDLDAPVREVVPEFTIGDDTAASAITPRQLLSHVSGFEGDLFNDTGVGDDAVEKYLATIADAPQLFAPGERFSYNNAAFVVLGRIVEVLRGTSYDQALRTHLAAPLGLTHVATTAAEAIMFRAALGHIPAEGSDEPVPAPVWSLVRSNAPAGSMLAMTARDLVTYARMHLDGGVAADGTRVLSEQSVLAMQERQVDLPELGLMGDAWGLGWEIFDWDGGPVIGHDGGTIGQNAFLRMVPGAGVAVAVLTNGGRTVDAYHAITSKVLAALAGVTVPELPSIPDSPVAIDLERILGTYSSSVSDSTVRVDDDGRIWLERTMKGIFAELGPAPEPVELIGWVRRHPAPPRSAERDAHAARLRRRRRQRTCSVPAHRTSRPPGGRMSSIAAAVPETDTTGVERRIAEIFADAGATGFLHAREIGVEGGPEVTVGADEPVVLASVFKILVLTAFVRAVAAGELDPAARTTVTARYRIGGVGTAGFADDVEMSWRDLALNMMTMSDNAATDVIYHRLGAEAIDRVISELALRQTQLAGCCEDLFASVVADLGGAADSDLDDLLTGASAEQILALDAVQPLRTSHSTPREVTAVLNALWTDAAAAPEACRQARDIMALQIWPHRLTSGFPAEVRIAAKTGTLPTWRNEAGVVTYPDGRQYAVAVFTRAASLSDRQPLVDASIGRAAFAAVEDLRAR
ncbi:serine hydrolase [Microbacterium sp. Ag1]|uniref:serine hydrolase n=2 Tax=unclassified Microbacterium TaxID=2609290 RepID=UPI0018CE6438|nr:serine hydrolase [Microbacterium sp. Ag1]